MRYNALGDTDLRVSAICLGSMTWGVQNTEAEGHAQLDRAVDAHGINFIDTAEMYPVPPTPETQGESERVIGSLLAARPGMRARVVIATKVIGASNNIPHIRDGKGRLDRAAIMAAVEGSLRRLRTDRIDLYQTHSTDRHVNSFGRQDYVHDPARDGAPIEETLRALEELVQDVEAQLRRRDPVGLVHRGDKAHGRQTDGHGLGLNIAHELARANGAVLRLISSQEDETIFETRLSMAD